MDKWVAPGRAGYGGRWRSWEEMSPEVLALIFGRFPADEILRTVPFVCRAWREAVAGPYCWSEIDVEAWCRRVNRADVIESAVRRLVRRSSGTLQRLSAYRLGNSSFTYAANYAKFLKVLQIPMSDVTDQTVEKCAKSFSSLAVLDISYCLKITSKGIEGFGKHCKSLIRLRRNMPPPDFGANQDGSSVQEPEAMAIANTMPRLEHLELAYGRFSDTGLDAILTTCKELCILDIRGCWNVKMGEDVELKCESIKELRDPWYDEYFAESSSDDNKNDDSKNEIAIINLVTSDESDDE